MWSVDERSLSRKHNTNLLVLTTCNPPRPPSPQRNRISHPNNSNDGRTRKNGGNHQPHSGAHYLATHLRLYTRRRTVQNTRKTVNRECIATSAKDAYELSTPIQKTTYFLKTPNERSFNGTRQENDDETRQKSRVDNVQNTIAWPTKN